MFVIPSTLVANIKTAYCTDSKETNIWNHGEDYINNNKSPAQKLIPFTYIIPFLSPWNGSIKICC
jgi:hypothetical protein